MQTCALGLVTGLGMQMHEKRVAQNNKASRYQTQVELSYQETTTNVEQSYLSIQLPTVR